MDFQLSPKEEAFRDEVRSFLDENLLPEGERADDFVGTWFQKIRGKRWVGFSWPREVGGGGGSIMEQVILKDEMAQRKAPPLGSCFMGLAWVGPAIIQYGTDEQKSRFLPEIASGTAVYCQGFSEPESGSDLASLQLKAVEDGDDYVLNGPKVWTSGAHRATHCYLMARTDPEAPKHRGISVFIVDMDTPGIEVKPIINMFGVHYFNQIFFEDVRVPKANMVGETDRGWYVAATSLDFERSGVGRFGSNRRSLEELVRLATETKRNGRALADDPVVRNRLAELWVANEAGKSVAYNVGWMQSKGMVPNMESSISKLMGSEIAQRIHQLGVKMEGMYGVLDKGSKWAYLDGRLAWEWMDSISFTIRAGTSEIQRNIIATRGLGLPRG